MHDLFAVIGADFELDDALETWRWLVPRPVTLIAMTVLGDLFLQESDGSVWFMDTIEGTYGKVAESVPMWRSLLDQRDQIERWFMPGFVRQLRAGAELRGGECFSPTQPPILSGGYEPENWQPTSWRVHFWSLGQIHHQVKELPPGTVITKVNFTPI